MQAFLWKIGTWLLNWILTKGLDRILQWFSNKQRTQERNKTNEINRQKVEQAIAEGKSDEETSQALEDALNGSKR